MATEKRLIDANALSNAIPGISKNMKRPGAVELACLLMIAEAPTVDAVEVVRCKDCRHWIERTADGIDTFHTCWFNDSITGRTHFCRYGERRTDA